MKTQVKCINTNIHTERDQAYKAQEATHSLDPQLSALKTSHCFTIQSLSDLW